MQESNRQSPDRLLQCNREHYINLSSVGKDVYVYVKLENLLIEEEMAVPQRTHRGAHGQDPGAVPQSRGCF
jgi:hypothetical protein